MKELVFLLEELSAKEMLKGLLPRMLSSEISVRYIVFEGKQDLERNIERKLRYYLNKEAAFIVMRDQDAADCKKIKQELCRKCQAAGKSQVLIRIACHELESFYLGDLKAVEQGLHINKIARQQVKSIYRDPDTIPNPVEILKRIAPSYQKVSGSRAIGPFLDPENIRSCSFGNLVRGIRKQIELL